MFKWLGLHMLSKLFEPLEEILETYWSVRRDFQRNQIFTSSQRLSACHNYKLWPLFSSYMKYLDVSYCYKDLGGWPCCQVVKFLFHFGGLGLGSINEWNGPSLQMQIKSSSNSQWIEQHTSVGIILATINVKERILSSLVSQLSILLCPV